MTLAVMKIHVIKCSFREGAPVKRCRWCLAGVTVVSWAKGRISWGPESSLLRLRCYVDRWTFLSLKHRRPWVGHKGRRSRISKRTTPSLFLLSVTSDDHELETPFFSFGDAYPVWSAHTSSSSAKPSLFFTASRVLLREQSPNKQTIN